MRAKFGCSQTVVSKKGGYKQTHTHVHKGTLQLYIGPSITIWLLDNNSVCIRPRIQLQIMQAMFDAQVTNVQYRAVIEVTLKQ